MSLSSNSELSLLQVVQDLEPSLPMFSLSSTEFLGLLQGIMTCFQEQAISAYVWFKLPPTAGWLNPLEDYFQSGLAQQVYHCESGTTLAKGSSFVVNPAPGWSNIALECSGKLQHEYFLILLAPELSILLIGEDLVTSHPPSFLTAKGLKFHYSLIPETIESVLQFLKQHITITDSTPEELTSDSVLTYPLPDRISASLLTQLWHHQLSNLVELSALAHPIPIPAINAESLEENQFLINVTTELSLPLTNMKTALRLLDAMQHKREQRQRYLALLQRECDRQTSLINGLQEVMQLNHPLDSKEQVVRMEDCVPGVVSTYQPIAEEKGISLGYHIPAGLPTVLCPTPWLRQILQHLLNNSLKFTPAKGKVYVRVTLQGEQVEIAVSDTGIGIETSDLPKLFHYFFRGRNALNSDTAGAGFGLGIVQQLVKRSGGSVTVSSHINRGTTFRILLPIEANHILTSG